MTGRAFDRAAALELLGIAGAFVFAVALVDPRGDFPLNDDWDFAKAAWAFAETGEFLFTPFTAASVRLQAVWGALWTKVFGASFDVLRASTLTLALATLLVLDRFLARFGVGRSTRLLCVGAMAFHPIWFWSSFTFMTHVPAIFASLLALAGFAEALRSGRLAPAAGGAAATVASFFIRQTGVFNAVAFLVIVLVLRERVSARWRSHAAIAAAPLFVFGLLFVTTDWLSGSQGELQRHYRFLFDGRFGQLAAAKMLSSYSMFNVMEAGLFFLPLSLLALAALLRGRREGRIVFGVAAAVVFARALWLVLLGLPMPFYSRIMRSEVFATNVFVNWGLGPFTLPDVAVEGLAYPFGAGTAWRVVLTFAAAALGAAVVAWCATLSAEGSPGERRTLVVRFLVLHLVVANCAIGLSYMYNDRYGLDAHWPLVILFALTVRPSRKGLAAAATALVLVALFSTAAVAEYLRWNRARWTAIAWLDSRGVAAESIDAGWEHLMMTRAVAGAPRPKDAFRRPREYRVAFNALPGYREIHRVPYERWFGLGRGWIRVLARE